MKALKEMKGKNWVIMGFFAALVVMGTLLLAKETGPVGWWKLDDGSGEIAADSSICKNHGVLKNGPSWVAGRINGTLDFENTDKTKIYVDIPNSPTLENVQEGDYTVAAWARPDRLPPGTEMTPGFGIVVKQGYHIGLVYDKDGLFKMQHHHEGGYSLAKSSPKAPDAWYHVVGVVSRTKGFVKIYVNGVCEATVPFTPGSAAREFGTVTWKLGVAGPDYDKFREAMDGKIDDVRIYNRALSPIEISQLAESTTL